MSIGLVASYIALGIGLLVLSILCQVVMVLIRADRTEAKKSASRVAGWIAALRGRAVVRDDVLPDGRMQAGMVYNVKYNRFEASGRNSEETLARVFKAKRNK